MNFLATFNTSHCQENEEIVAKGKEKRMHKDNEAVIERENRFLFHFYNFPSGEAAKPVDIRKKTARLIKTTKYTSAESVKELIVIFISS